MAQQDRRCCTEAGKCLPGFLGEGVGLAPPGVHTAGVVPWWLSGLAADIGRTERFLRDFQFQDVGKVGWYIVLQLT